MHIVFARHTTPLSLWRGVGGEAGCRLFFIFFLLLPLSSEYAEQVKEEIDEVEIER